MAEEKKDGIKFKLKFDPTAVKAKPAAAAHGTQREGFP